MQTATNKPDAEGDLKSLSLPELQAKLGSSPAGLTQFEVERRLAQYGYNEISDKKTNPLIKFLSYWASSVSGQCHSRVLGG